MGRDENGVGGMARRSVLPTFARGNVFGMAGKSSCPVVIVKNRVGCKVLPVGATDFPVVFAENRVVLGKKRVVTGKYRVVYIRKFLGRQEPRAGEL